MRRPQGSRAVRGDGVIYRSLDVGAASPARVLEAVKRAAEAAGLTAEQAAPDTMLLVGRTRPDWCLPVGGLLALPTVGLSLLLLRVRTASTAMATLLDTGHGRYLEFVGRLPDYLPAVVEGLLADEDPVEATDVIAAPEPTPWAPARRGIPAGFDDASEIYATLARPRRIDLSAAAPVLAFDDGMQATVISFALIGRAPSAAVGDPPAQLLLITDPGLSVSKTHLAVGVDVLGFWVCDRHSTNGTVITDGRGVKTKCAAGKRYYVESGSTVGVGDRSFSVVLSAVSAGRSN